MQTPQRLSLGDISVNFAKVILDTVDSLGFQSAELAHTYNLDADFLNTPDARISIPKYMRLGHHAIRLCKLPQLGLELGNRTSNTILGMSGLTAMCAPDLAQGLSTLINLEQLNSYNSRGKSSFFIEEDRAHCIFYSVSPYNRYNYFVVDWMLSTWWQFVQANASDKAECHHIEIEYDRPSYAEVFESHFNCPVYFGQPRNALVLKRAHHKIPLNTHSAASFKKMHSLCLQEKNKLESGKRFADKVIELISANLTGKPPNIETIAKHFGMGGWTLRRRLQDENTSFQSLLDETRNALAQSYVRDTENNFTEIAFLLGFSSPSAFQRAFKRWTNLSPGDYRKNQSGE